MRNHHAHTTSTPTPKHQYYITIRDTYVVHQPLMSKQSVESRLKESCVCFVCACLHPPVWATSAAFLEAPVSGSKKPAEDGTLIFLTAGRVKGLGAFRGALPDSPQLPSWCINQLQGLRGLGRIAPHVPVDLCVWRVR